VKCFLEIFSDNDKISSYLGPYPVGKTAKTSLPFRRGPLWFQDNNSLPPSSNLLTVRPRQITSFPWDLLSKINQSEFAAVGGRRNEQNGGLCSRRSLVPRPQSPIFPAFLFPFPLLVNDCYAGYVNAVVNAVMPPTKKIKTHNITPPNELRDKGTRLLMFVLAVLYYFISVTV